MAKAKKSEADLHVFDLAVSYSATAERLEHRDDGSSLLRSSLEGIIPFPDHVAPNEDHAASEVLALAVGQLCTNDVRRGLKPGIYTVAVVKVHAISPEEAEKRIAALRHALVDD